jgi:hypothetical protein
VVLMLRQALLLPVVAMASGHWFVVFAYTA